MPFSDRAAQIDDLLLSCVTQGNLKSGGSDEEDFAFALPGSILPVSKFLQCQ
jgi:hypothetical protein